MHRLVFLHYLGGSATEWQGVIAALPQGFETLTIDLPGFGRQATTCGYDVAAMADHVTASLGEEPAGGWTLVGHSMGAKVATVLARRAADGASALRGLAGLVLVAGSPPSPEPMEEEKRAAMLSWFDGDAGRSRKEAEGYVTSNAHGSLGEAVLSRAVADALGARRDAWTAWLSSGSREDWRERVGTLDLPTLLVAGAEDEALGAEAQRTMMAPHFSRARLEVVEGVGHLIPLEKPAYLAALITRHVVGAGPALPVDYAAFVGSSRVSAGTREVLLARLSPQPAERSVLAEGAMRTLGAAMRRLLPQRSPEPIDLAARFAEALLRDGGDGWRYAALPPDRDAAIRGLATLDRAALARGASEFAGLGESAQDEVLADGIAGELAVSSAPDGLDASEMRLWLEDLRAAATRSYVSHPATLARLGYSGIANGGDGSPKRPWTRIGEGEREAWEPLPAVNP